MGWNENLRIAFETKLKNEVSIVDSAKIDFGDNSSFKPPTLKVPWLRSWTNILKSENAEIGTKFQRHTGDFVIQCFDDEGKGEKGVNLIVDEIIEIFQNKSFSGVNCFVVTPVNIGANNGWYQKNAKVRFVYNVFN